MQTVSDTSTTNLAMDLKHQQQLQQKEEGLLGDNSESALNPEESPSRSTHPNNDDRNPKQSNNSPQTDDTTDSTVAAAAALKANEPSSNSYYDPKDEICLEGEILLETFVDQQISKAGIITSGCETPRTLRKASVTTNIRNAGLELRRMADAFELTYERQKVKEKANEIGVGVQTYTQFRELLSAMFNPGGITHSRIIVLFFFCSDVAIRSLKAGIDIFKRFMQWSFKYFAERVCDWVKKNGGWVAVLSPHQRYPRVAAGAAAAAFIVVCAVVYRFVKK